jgi:hypothetical protein
MKSWSVAQSTANTISTRFTEPADWLEKKDVEQNGYSTEPGHIWWVFFCFGCFISPRKEGNGRQMSQPFRRPWSEGGKENFKMKNTRTVEGGLSSAACFSSSCPLCFLYCAGYREETAAARKGVVPTCPLGYRDGLDTVKTAARLRWTSSSPHPLPGPWSFLVGGAVYRAERLQVK